MLDLVGNPEDRFSRVAAHITFHDVMIVSMLLSFRNPLPTILPIHLFIIFSSQQLFSPNVVIVEFTSRPSRFRVTCSTTRPLGSNKH